MKKELTQRISEIKELYSKLQELGIHKRFNAMDIFYKDVQEYVKEGISSSGKIKLLEIDRILYYKLTPSLGKQNEVVLRHFASS